MNADQTRLDELAGAILDGAPIDWDAAASHAPAEDRPLLHHLQQIAAVASVHRDDASEPGSGPAPAGDDHQYDPGDEGNAAHDR